MQAAATFTEKTGAGNKSTHERFSRQLLPSFLPAIQLGSLKMASARLRAALHLFFPGADHLLSKYHAPLVTEISWGRRDYYTAQPLALSQTKSIWSLYDLGKVSSCLPSFAGQVLWLLIFPSSENQLLKQSQIRDFKKRRELLCTSNATVMSLNGVFPTSVCISKCLLLMKWKAKASRSFPGYSMKPKLPSGEECLCFILHKTRWHSMGLPAMRLRNISNFFDAKSWWCWCCSCWGQL